MKLKILMMALLTMNFVSACSEVTVPSKDGLFKDVSKRPPDAKAETLVALSRDREFADWVVYQDRQCDNHGCIQ